MKNTMTVYGIFTSNGDVYIGSTSNFNRRMRDHKNIATNPSHPKQSYKLYKAISNTPYTIIKLQENVSESMSQLIEQAMIDSLGANLNSNKASKITKDYTLSNKAKKNIANGHNKEVEMTDLDGNILAIFNSAKNASQFTGIPLTTLKSRATGQINKFITITFDGEDTLVTFKYI